jgi:hypothetical protein
LIPLAIEKLKEWLEFSFCFCFYQRTHFRYIVANIFIKYKEYGPLSYTYVPID